ncbi:YeeE/YedE thiosulfate transporter family protein [uncultured Roseobacter sp.]|uniref:YeeE/YedE thiosulfate transporter family protein n=1 Tax=uncultured Roseobacter sp. TaxID=114847 RepID=UPI002620A78B|nr:YeeE/YedE thiosulfate transporter family protein [uncultured Roseobacter sp.]
MFSSAIILFAFILGFALSRASTCTVAATKRLVLQRRIDWFLGIMVAVSWSALTLFVLHSLLPGTAARPDSYAMNATLFAASAVMGLGAWMNGGCFIGTIGHISSGNLSYIATFLGLALSRLIGQWPPVTQALDLRPVPRMSPDTGLLYWIIVGSFAALVMWSIWRIYRRRQQAVIALGVMGVAAALLFAHRPDWSYEALIGRFVQGQPVSQDLTIELAVAALFAGAILSSALNSRFRLSHAGLRTTIWCFLGGTLMGLGALYVPGGNDTQLLWVMPGLAFHGFAAYLTMVAVVAMMILLFHRKNR